MTPLWPARGLYVLADARLGALAPGVAAAALQGGACLLQYRDKARAGTRSEVLALRRLCGQQGIPFIVNDDVALARTLGADGVHLGRDDLSVEQARRVLGPEVRIGVSCYADLERAEQAAASGADYLAFGSFYLSATKPSATSAPVALLQQARAQWSLPLVAIGGITPDNGAVLVRSGADFLAVASGVFAHADPEARARRYACLFEGE